MRYHALPCIYNITKSFAGSLTRLCQGVQTPQLTLIIFYSTIKIGRPRFVSYRIDMLHEPAIVVGALMHVLLRARPFFYVHVRSFTFFWFIFPATTFFRACLSQFCINKWVLNKSMRLKCTRSNACIWNCTRLHTIECICTRLHVNAQGWTNLHHGVCSWMIATANVKIPWY